MKQLVISLLSVVTYVLMCPSAAVAWCTVWQERGLLVLKTPQEHFLLMALIIVAGLLFAYLPPRSRSAQCAGIVFGGLIAIGVMTSLADFGWRWPAPSEPQGLC